MDKTSTIVYVHCMYINISNYIVWVTNNIQEEFEDTKGVIRISELKKNK